MTLIDLVIRLVVLGLILYLVDNLPIDAAIKRVVHLVLVVVVILWLLSVFLGDVTLIRLRP